MNGAIEALAQQGPDASIDSITERANVAHGTFYDHFASRRELLTRAMLEALDEFNSWIDTQVPEGAMASEELALRMRHFGRMPEHRPTLAAAFSSAGGFEAGFASPALKHIDVLLARATDSGEFIVSSAEAATAIVIGSIGWLVAVRTAYPHNGTDRVDAVAEFVLNLLGIDQAEAHAVCHTRGPDLPMRTSRRPPVRPTGDEPDGSRSAARQDRSRRTRARLIEAALEVLADEGTHVSIERISSQAGVSRAAFYRYFATKQDLFEAASIAGLQQWEDYCASRLSASQSPAEQFIMAMRLYGRLPDTHPQVARAFYNLGNFAAGYPTGTDPTYQALYDDVIARGTFRSDADGTGLLTLAGTLEWLITRRALPSALASDITDEVLALVLPGFGLSASQVGRALRRPLPPPPRKQDA